jgi:outer membrane protein OmpA-like peptidoglycan-associated protein
MKTASLLLAGTALVALGFHSIPAGAVEQSFIVAQTNPKPDAEPRPGRAQQRQERQERQQQQAPAVRQQQPAAQTQAPAAQAPAPAAQTQAPAAPAPQINRNAQQETPRLQSAPRNETAPARAQNEQRPPAATRPDRDDRRPAAQQQPAQQERSTQQSTTPQNERDRQNRNADQQRDRQSPSQQNQNQNADTQRDRRNQNADQQRDRTSPAQTQTGQTPAANERGRQQQAGDADQARPRDSSEFIRRDGNAKARTVDDVRSERREERQGNRTVIREGDRTIVREGNRTVIRHNETTRFTIGARGVNVQRVGGETRTVVERAGGVRIVTVTDTNGRLLRRVRIVNGREFVILNNSFRGPNYQVFVMLPPPVIRIPRERYIVNYVVGMPAPVIYETLLAEPVEPIAERYTIEQVRYSEPVRARMPRVDLDLNFETGSWQLTPEQIEKLNVIADGIKRATERNPQEVFLIEGHTDSVGSDEDNLSLSDRRAEAVAVALTEQYQVPPENLVTQGYGEQNPKVDTQGPSEENRRVSVRRITPLLAQEQGTTGGGGGQPQ